MNATQYPTPTTADTARLPRFDETRLDQPRFNEPRFDQARFNEPRFDQARGERPIPARGPRPALDATKLWTGGLASAVIAALVSLVGMLVLRVVGQAAPYGHDLFAAISNPVLLCVGAAVAALAATAVAHLLLVSTPSPLAYLGWILGLSTAVATVLPFAVGLPLGTAVAVGRCTW